MRYTLLFGDEVKVSVGDKIIVDQGDSVGQLEYAATVVDVFEDRLILELSTGGCITEFPSDVVDICRLE